MCLYYDNISALFFTFLMMKFSYLNTLSLLGLLLTFNVTFSQTQSCTNCGVGEVNPDAKLEVKGCGNTHATKSLQITNSDDKESLVVTDGGNVLINEGALAFRNGVGVNLVSKYISNIDVGNPVGKYVSINTNIPFENDKMMSSLKLSYWSYNNNFDMHIGWYTYGNGASSGPLRFHSVNGYISGVTKTNAVANGLCLSNNNGKVRISIPYYFFEMFGSLTVSSDNSGRYLNDEWSKNWTIENDEAPTVNDRKVIYLKNRTGANFFVKNNILNENRAHNLNGKTLGFTDGNVGIGNNGVTGYGLYVSTSSDQWATYINNHGNAHGLLVDVASKSSGTYPFWVRSGTGSSKENLFVVKANGNVGIGTNGPKEKLDVAGAIQLSTSDDGYITENFGLRRGSSGQGNLDAPGDINVNIDANNNQTNARFKITTNAGTEVFRVNEYGNVAIGSGISAPEADLHVFDDGRIRLEHNSYGKKWDINQAGNDGLVIEKVGDANSHFKIQDDGKIVIKAASFPKLEFLSTTPTAWNYYEFRSPSSRQAWVGIKSPTGDFHISKETGGDIVLQGDKANGGEILLKNAKRVKITDLVNLPIYTTLPSTDVEPGDLALLENNAGKPEMWVYMNATSGWLQLNKP